MSATPVCMCQVCETSHIKSSPKDWYPGLLVFDPVGGNRCSSIGSQGQNFCSWMMWIFSVHSRTLAMRAEERHGTGSFDVCTRNGEYSRCIEHRLPTVMLTNEYTTWCSFQSHGYFRNHVTSSSPVQRWDLKYLLVLELFVRYEIWWLEAAEEAERMYR